MYRPTEARVRRPARLLNREKISQVLDLLLESLDSPLVVYEHQLLNPFQPIIHGIEPLIDIFEPSLNHRR